MALDIDWPVVDLEIITLLVGYGASSFLFLA